MKTFNTQYNVGNIKYLVNFHDGIKKHSDGSDFFDIATPKNKKDYNAFVKELLKDGYTEQGSPKPGQKIYDIKPAAMSLEKITLLVEKDQIIDNKYKFLVLHVYTDYCNVFAVGFNDADSKVVATSKDHKTAKEFLMFHNDILQQEIAKDLTAWDFVEKFYHNYSSCNDIAYNNDLSVIMEGEPDEDSCAMMVFKLLDKNMETVKTEMQLSNAKIYERAINEFLQSHPNLVRS